MFQNPLLSMITQPSPATLKKVWQSVPPDYYQKGVTNNIFQNYWHLGKLTTILSQLSTTPRNVLDVGCASGWFLSQLKSHYPDSHCVGIDVSPDLIKFGKEHYPQLELFTADAHHLPFKKHLFDTIVCTEVLEHVVDPLQVLREIRRVSVPNSQVIIEMDSGNMLFKLVWFFWTKFRGKVWENAHLHAFTDRKLKHLIKLSQLRIIQEKYFHLQMAVSFLCRS